MIIGGVTGVADKAGIGDFTTLPSHGVGGAYDILGGGNRYNGHLFVVRVNTATRDVQVFNYTTQTVLWTQTNNSATYSQPAQYGQYLYVGYSQTAAKKFTIKKVDLTDGSATTIWTDGGVVAVAGGLVSASWNIEEGKIAFCLRGSNRRVILTIDPTDDGVVELITDAQMEITALSCTSSYIYYVDGPAIWKRMDWDGANKVTSSATVSAYGPTGPNGLHMQGVVAMYDADGTNQWGFDSQLRGGYFLTDSMPYYLIGFTSDNAVRVYKLATGSVITVLETLATDYNLNLKAGTICHMPYENFEGIHGISYSIIGQNRSILTYFPNREHN